AGCAKCRMIPEGAEMRQDEMDAASRRLNKSSPSLQCPTEVPAMPMCILAVVTAGSLFAAEPPKDDPKAAAKLWPTVGVNTPPIFHSPQPQKFFRQPDRPERLMIEFTVVNDGATVVDPDIESSQLLVNGKLIENWDLNIRNGLRDNRWNRLPPGDYLSFGYDFTTYFQAAGTYILCW